MILTAHQPVYLPWLGLFHKIAMADLFISFDQVQYQPKDWNSRNRIKSASGPTMLSVPVLRKGYREKTISDIAINNSEPWARKHWKSLKIAYAKTPYFGRYAGFFEETYHREWSTLVELNEHMLRWFLDTLGIRVPVRSAGEWEFRGEKGDLVLDMCKQVGASEYIFGALGRDYADVSAFDAAGVKAHFQDYQHPVYPQQHDAFVSNLSIVDLLFNCGDESRDILLSGNLTHEALLLGHVKETDR
jgi:hypothetical protein